MKDECLIIHFQVVWILPSLRFTKVKVSELTKESRVYIVDSPIRQTRASLLNPAACFLSGPALSGGRGWTSELRQQLHSESLRANIHGVWEDKVNVKSKWKMTTVWEKPSRDKTWTAWPQSVRGRSSLTLYSTFILQACLYGPCCLESVVSLLSVGASVCLF